MTDAQLIKLPITGAEIDVSTASGAVAGLRATVEFQRDVANLQRACRETLRRVADERGERSFAVDGIDVVVDYPTLEREYDVQRLWDELSAVGLPKERLGLLITYEPRVDGRIIRQLERNAVYKAVIDSCTIRVKEKTRRVEVG